MDMSELTYMFYPLTANIYDGKYREYAPCDSLKPYIRCFWSSYTSSVNRLVIPDACMDILFSIDHGTRSISASFCTLDEYGYISENVTSQRSASIFGIRFYAWTAALFTDHAFTGDKEYNTEDLFSGLKYELMPVLESRSSLKEFSRAAEKALLKRLDRSNINSTIMNSVYDILYSCGTIRTAELAKSNAVSVRHLERLFMQSIGASPKAFSSVIRYQMIWQEICRKSTDILDLAEKYGYSDQAHLINDFRKRHTMTPMKAVKYSEVSHFYNTEHI